MEPRLVAVSGPLQGQIFKLSEDEVLVGKRGAATLAIEDGSVSSRHCVFIKSGDSFTVRDLGSARGTLVNGEIVAERLLQHADCVGVGNTTLLFLIGADDLSSLLSNVCLTENPMDPALTVELRHDTSIYLHPEETLAGAADIHIAQGFAAVVRLATAIRSQENLSALQEQVLELIMEAIPADIGVIVLTANSDQIISMFGRRSNVSDSITASRTVIDRVLKEKTALLNNGIIETIPGRQAAAPSGSKSVLCVPLLSHDRAFGVIYLSKGQAGFKFGDSHLQLLAAFAAILTLPLESAVRLEWLERENRRLQSDIDEDHHLIGDSPVMKQIDRFIGRVAATDSTVLIRGESGTGKELVARALHRRSPRSKAPFVAINCAALRDELLESELFGHEKGSFTSAVTQKKGKFEIADGGTLFLDELGEMSPQLQVKLLRVLQEREMERVGGLRTIKVNVRVIAATDQDLEEAIRQGRFRPELYYRVNVVSIVVPPLRQRADDLVQLAHYFALRYAARYNSRVRGISLASEACLKRYDWPGNVRELQNAIERAVVLSDGDLIMPEDLPEAIIDAGPPSGLTQRFHNGVRDAKRRLIQKALEQAGGNHAEAAQLLAVNRTYLHRLIKNLGL